MRLRALVLAPCLLLAGCAGFRPANQPIEAAGPVAWETPKQPRSTGDVFLYLAFSGGGTRAAAFAYGVLEELRDTQVAPRGEPRRLLDEVDHVSGVSGGSFTAAYYGLFGDRIFEEFEGRFLRRNVQGALIFQALRPRNLLRLLTPYLNRSELASQYYDRVLFEKARFADLAAAPGPTIHINATDLSQGTRFTFHPGQFNVLCSDLDRFRVSRAVAASSAVPLLLSPVTLENFASRCDFQQPPWLEEALASRESNPRRYRAAQDMLSYRDAKSRRYVHLVDGGIADNLGMRAMLEMVEAGGGAERTARYSQIELPQQIAVIVVNAETDPDPAIDLSAASPSFASLMNSVSGAQIRRYNFETLVLTAETIRGWAHDLSTPERPVTAHLIDVSFEALRDEAQRRYLKRLPTSFALSDDQVDRLRAAGRQLLRDSPSFQRLLEQLR